jgi:glycerate kinase
MQLRLLIAPDKFKGTISAQAAAEAIAKGWRRERPADKITLLPMSDGGEGFGEVMRGFARFQVQRLNTVDAAHRPCKAEWWWQNKTKTALVETARIIGLAMLPAKKFHPFDLDTLGLGAVFDSVARKGAIRCLVGIGGSATNDGGFGMARSLGWKFLDQANGELTSWTELRQLRKIQPPPVNKDFGEVLVAVDVRNPLTGPKGATRIYGPQKGLLRSDFAIADACLAQLVKVWKKQFGCDLKNIPGTGAAGGLGFGLMAFLGARLEPGFELFARHSDVENLIRTSDLVITGEGAIDQSTLMGKGVGQLAVKCLKSNVPCLALAGVVDRTPGVNRMFSQANALTELASADEAKANAATLLAKLASQFARTVDVKEFAFSRKPAH